MSSELNQLMGFDFGTSRMGVAVGQSLTATASPLPPLPAREGKPDWQQLDSLVAEWQPQALVIGVPLNMDGTISEMAYRARKFANRLHERYKLPCFLQDERLSTREAKSIHFARGGSNDFRRESVDGIAACLILESWFNSTDRIPSQTRLEDAYEHKQS